MVPFLTVMLRFWRTVYLFFPDPYDLFALRTITPSTLESLAMWIVSLSIRCEEANTSTDSSITSSIMVVETLLRKCNRIQQAG